MISFEELTTTAFQISALTLEVLEAFTVIGIVYLALVWTLSLLIRRLEARLSPQTEARSRRLRFGRPPVEALGRPVS